MTSCALGPHRGDGLLASIIDGLPTKVTVIATEISSNTRAGMLFDRSADAVVSSVLTGNQFGIVSQRVDVGEDPLLAGNLERDKVLGGDLSVPDNPLPAP